VPVEIFARREDGGLVHEEGETEVVSAHGALVRTNQSLPQQQVEIILGQSPSRRLAWVLESHPAKEDGLVRIAVEFTVPCKEFWVD
jgi:hypothetical protein